MVELKKHKKNSLFFVYIKKSLQHKYFFVKTATAIQMKRINKVLIFNYLVYSYAYNIYMFMLTFQQLHM